MIEIYLTTDRGERLAFLDQFMQLEYTRTVNDVGMLTGVWSQQVFDPAWLRLDNRVEVWRDKSLDFVGLLRYWELRTSGMVSTVDIICPDYNEILSRRIVAYADGSAQADKTATPADNLMKAIVRENLGASCVVTARDLTAWGLSVAPDESLGPSLDKTCSRRGVLYVLQELADAAATAGTRTYFALMPLTSSTCEFRTWINQPGVDRSGIVLVGVEHGNLNEPAFEYDAMNEVTYAYAGGQGEGAVRNIQVTGDDARIGVSAINRREGWTDATGGSTDALVLAEAKAAVKAGQPRRLFGGQLLNTPGCQYGRDWNFGDLLTAIYNGQSYTCLVKSVTVRVRPDTGETIDAELEML